MLAPSKALPVSFEALLAPSEAPSAPSEALTIPSEALRILSEAPSGPSKALTIPSETFPARSEALPGGYSHVLLKGHLRLGLLQAAYFISLLHIST